jgi:hypothetical protein
VRGLLRQHVVLLSEQQVALFRRSSISTRTARITHPVQRVMLREKQTGKAVEYLAFQQVHEIVQKNTKDEVTSSRYI